jgi:hypothetical protein
MLTGDASTARSAAAILGRADASLDFVSLFRQPEHRKLFDDALRQIAGLSELPIADLGKNVATFALPGI